MFATKRLITVTLRATSRSIISKQSSLSSKHFYPLSSTVSVVSTISRGYATRRRGGASSKPVQVKEREKEKKGAEVAPGVEEAPLSDQQQQDASAYQYQRFYGQQASDVINGSASLQAFLKRTMTTTGIGIGVSAVSAAAFMQIPFVLLHPYICLGVGLVSTLGSLVGMGMIRPTYVQEGEILKAVDPPARKALFGAFLVGEGLTLAPVLAMVSVVAPMSIPVAGSLALGTMAGMVAYSLKQPQGSLARWGPALYVGVVGLIGAGLVNLFVHSSALAMVSSAISVGIFAAFTAYDTHTAIDDHNSGRPDHLYTAANFFINFVNLFLDYLRLVRSFFSD